MRLSHTTPASMIDNEGEPAFPTMTQASANSEPLSSSESTAAQTIAFGVVTSVAALVALYLSYKQLRIMRSRRSRPPTPGDPEDVFPSGVITDAYPLYPLQHRGAGAGYAQEAPGDSGYLLHITRSQTIHQVTVRTRDLPFGAATWVP